MFGTVRRQIFTLFFATTLLAMMSPVVASDEEFSCAAVDSAFEEFTIDDAAALPGELVIDDDLPILEITDYGTAIAKKRWKRSDGRTPNTGKITLGVAFLNGSEADKKFVRKTAIAWLDGRLGTVFDLKFDVDAAQSEVRIRFDPNGSNNSYVGTENKAFATSVATLNIRDVTRRTVLHEFGHVLGLQHEMQHPSSGIAWDETVVFAATSEWGWDKKKTRQQILDRLQAVYACVGDPGFNEKSIMIYPIRSGWDKNGFTAGQNDEITDRDIDCLMGVYDD